MCKQPMGPHNKELLKGLCLEEALTRVGGQRSALDEGIRGGRIIRREVAGLEVFFFPRFKFGQSSEYTEKLSGEEKKVNDKGMLPSILDEGFKWQPQEMMLPSAEPSSDMVFALPGFPTQRLLGGVGKMMG